MKRAVLSLALLCALGGLATWLATGAHRGWSKTSVAITVVDDVTGIESQTYQDRFVAGVDFLAATLLAAAGLGVVSALIKKPEPATQTSLS